MMGKQNAIRCATPVSVSNTYFLLKKLILRLKEILFVLKTGFLV